MSYGLYDGDLPFYDRFPFLNLELMKLSTYYKKKREIVSLTQKYMPQRFSNYIVRQDYPNPNVSYSYYKNVQFGGKAFQGSTYRPLPLEVEVCKPDIGLYNNIKFSYKYTESDAKSFQVMRNAIHLRLSLDGRTIWPDFYKQLPLDRSHSGFIFHDDNLENLPDVIPLIQDLMEEHLSIQARRIGNKYPIQVSTENRYLDWLQLLAINKYYSIQYNGIPRQEFIKEIATTTAHTKRLAQTVQNVTTNTTYNQFITQDLVSIMRNSAILCTYGAQIPLIFDDTFFIDKRWADVTWLIQLYINFLVSSVSRKDQLTRVIPYETFFNYYRNMLKYPPNNPYKLKKEFIQETFQFVRENNYELFTLFYKPIKEIANESHRN